MTGRVVVREATLEDRRALWEWRNDPVTSKMFNTDQSVDYRDHCRWFNELLTDPNQLLCIGLIETMRIGSVRFKRQDDGKYEVGLYLKPPYSGRGYGPQVLKESVRCLSELRNPTTVFATIHQLNPGSKKLFENAGFHCKPASAVELHCELGLKAH